MATSITDACFQGAGKALQALDLSPKDHLIWRENVATYLGQLREDFVQGLDRKEGSELKQALTHAWPYGEKRWGDKLERDVEKPYTDEEVSGRLDSIQTELENKLSEVLSLNPAPFKMKVYVSGSLVKGRFGANSDLDLIMDSGENPVKEAKSSYADQVHIQYIAGGHPRWRQAYLDSFGEKVEIDPSEVLNDHHFVHKMFQSAMEKKGYAFEGSHWKMQRHVVRQKEVAPPNTAGIIWSFADLPA